MSGDDGRKHWLAEQLDRELSSVHSAPDALRNILDRAADQRSWWRRDSRLAGTPVWLVAAAAVLVLAVAVPVLLGALVGRGGPTDRLISTGTTPDPTATSTQTSLATAPSRPVRTTPTRRTQRPAPPPVVRTSPPPPVPPHLPPRARPQVPPQVPAGPPRVPPRRRPLRARAAAASSP